MRLTLPGFEPHVVVADVSRESVLVNVALGGGITIVTESSLGVRIAGVVHREIHEASGPLTAPVSGYWQPENPSPTLRRFLQVGLWLHREKNVAIVEPAPNPRWGSGRTLASQACRAG